MKPVRTVGIVNGGGDAPGLNAVIRAVVRTTISQHGMRVIGIRNGFDGLIWPEGAKEMTEESVSGAHIILIPEISFKFEHICDAVRARELRGKRFSLIVVAEGVKLPATDPSGKPVPPAGPGNVANTIAFTLREMLHKEIRVTVLGHVQRGGSPTPFDRILGTRLGVAATDLVAKHQFGRMVCLKSGKIESVSLDEALEKMKYVDPASEIVHSACSVGATFGDSA